MSEEKFEQERMTVEAEIAVAAAEFQGATADAPSADAAGAGGVGGAVGETAAPVGVNSGDTDANAPAQPPRTRATVGHADTADDSGK